MAVQRQPAYRLGLDIGRQRALRGPGPGFAGLPQLGARDSARRPHHCRFFRQPHPAVRRPAVHRHIGRRTPHLPRGGFHADRRRYRGFIAQELISVGN